MDKKKTNLDITRRDMVKMLSLAGAASVLAISPGSLSSVLSAPKVTGPKAPAKIRSLQELKLPTDSNAVLTLLDSTKVEVRFPTDGKGYMKPGKNEFKDEDDLVNYLSLAFPFSREDK